MPRPKSGKFFETPCTYTIVERCPISPHVHAWMMECKNILQLFSLVIKTKLVQNVNRMSERQNDMPKDGQTDRKTDRRQNDFSA